MLAPHWQRSFAPALSESRVGIGRNFMHPFVLNIFMLYATATVTVALGIMLIPVPAGDGGLPRIDRGVFCIAVVVISTLLAALLIAAFYNNQEGFRWVIARPFDRLLTRYHWVMFAGAGLYVFLRLCGATARRSLWVLCLSLPGALTFPATFVAAVVLGVGDWAEVILEFMIHPATVILPLVAWRQWLWLQTSRDIRAVSALALTLLVIAAYLLDEPVLPAGLF